MRHLSTVMIGSQAISKLSLKRVFHFNTRTHDGVGRRTLATLDEWAIVCLLAWGELSEL